MVIYVSFRGVSSNFLLIGPHSLLVDLVTLHFVRMLLNLLLNVQFSVFQIADFILANSRPHLVVIVQKLLCQLLNLVIRGWLIYDLQSIVHIVGMFFADIRVWTNGPSLLVQ